MQLLLIVLILCIIFLFRNCDPAIQKRVKIIKLVLIILCIIGLFHSCKPAEPLDVVSQTLNLDVTDYQLLNFEDTHGGFQGEGETTATLSLTPEQTRELISEIRDNDHWHPLPLSENLTRVLYGITTEDYQLDPLFRDENHAPLLPEIKNGWYYFRDQHTESTDCTDDTALFSRNSRNFDVAVLDTDRNILYVFTLDT